jgi:hypothetical protein
MTGCEQSDSVGFGDVAGIEGEFAVHAENFDGAVIEKTSTMPTAPGLLCRIWSTCVSLDFEPRKEYRERAADRRRVAACPGGLKR